MPTGAYPCPVKSFRDSNWETAFQISAQLGFYDILVLYGGQGSRSTEEVMCLVEHVVLVQQFTEYLEITRLYWGR